MLKQWLKSHNGHNLHTGQRQPVSEHGNMYFYAILVFVTSNERSQKKILSSSTLPQHMQYESVELMCPQISGTYEWTQNFCRNSNVRGRRRKVAFIFYTHQVWDSFQINEYVIFPALSFVLLFELLPWNNQLRPIDFNKLAQKTMWSLKSCSNLFMG